LHGCVSCITNLICVLKKALNTTDFNCALEFVIKKAKHIQEEPEMNATNQLSLLVCGLSIKLIFCIRVLGDNATAKVVLGAE